MTHYKLVLRNGNKKHQDATDKQHLIELLFGGDMKKFKDEVSRLEWQEKTLHCIEHTDTGEIEHRVVGADTNPYGWRKENPKV